jgi:elongation factor P
MDVSDLKKNVKLLIDGNPWMVTDFQFVKPGKGQGLYKCKIKNMISGAVVDRTWRSGEKLETANVESRSMQYLFTDGVQYTFMDSESFDQVEIASEVISDDARFLMDQLEVDVLFFQDRAVGVTLPGHVVMEVTEAEPGVKGDTTSGATKGATVQSGLSLQVPLFIKPGELIKIDTRTCAYIERVNR